MRRPWKFLVFDAMWYFAGILMGVGLSKNNMLLMVIAPFLIFMVSILNVIHFDKLVEKVKRS